jgi:hypothetical protein
VFLIFVSFVSTLNVAYLVVLLLCVVIVNKQILIWSFIYRQEEGKKNYSWKV